MAETIAPAPPGVQAPPTYVPPTPPQEPLKVKAGDKYKAELEKLTKSQDTGTEIGKSDQGQSQPDIEKKADLVPAPEKPVEKPASPLDAVLAKAPKEEKPVEEPDVLKEFDEAKPDWKRARGVMKSQSEQIRELTGKIKTFETTPKAEPAVVEALTRERDAALTRLKEQDEKLKGLNYTFSEEYQGLIAARESDLSKLVSRIKSYGGDSEAVLAALALPEGKVRTNQIEEALAEVADKNRGRIDILIDKIEEHDDKISDAQKDSPRRWEQLQQQREVELAEQSQAAIKNLETQYGKVTERLSELAVTFREVPDDVPGAAEWNKEIRDALQGGLAVLKPDGAGFEDSAIIAAKGQRYDSLEKRYLSLHSDYTELKRQYTELSGAGPDFKGGGKPTTKVEKKPGAKYHEALATFQGAGLGEV